MTPGHLLGLWAQSVSTFAWCRQMAAIARDLPASWAACVRRYPPDVG